MKNIIIYIILTLNAVSSYANKTISGIIKDGHTGEPLPYVDITIKGSKLGTKSDIDGKYEIDAPEGSIIEFTYSDYETQTRKITERTKSTLNINMVDNFEDPLFIKSKIKCKIKHVGAFSVFSKDSLIGLMDSTGKIVFDPIYNDIVGVFNCLYAISKGNVAGLIDENGNWILPMKYSKILVHENKNTISLEDTLGIVSSFDTKTKQIKSDNYPLFKKKKWYKINEYNKLEYCLVDSNGTSISDYFTYIYPTRSGRALAEKESIVGFIDTKNGTFKELPQWRNANIINGTFFNYYDLTKITLNNGTCGLLDSLYKEFIPFQYEDLQPHKEFIIAQKKGKYGVISYQNKTLIPFIYDNLKIIYPDQLLIAEKNEKFGIISVKKKKKILPFIYDYLDVCYDDGIIGYNQQIYFSHDNFIIDYPIDFLCFNSYDLYANIDNKSYLISLKGDILSEYDSFIKDYKINRVKKFSLNENYGIVEGGKIILPAKYSEIVYVGDSLTAKFYDEYNGKYYGIYTQNGKLIDQSKYVYSHTRKEEFYKDIHRWYKVKNDSIFGIYDLYGNSIVPEKYIDIQTVYVNKKYHFIITDKEGLKGAYSTEGKCILPVKYENIRYDAETNQIVGEE